MSGTRYHAVALYHGGEYIIASVASDASRHHWDVCHDACGTAQETMYHRGEDAG